MMKMIYWLTPASLILGLVAWILPSIYIPTKDIRCIGDGSFCTYDLYL